jgi:hypothetical protein
LTDDKPQRLRLIQGGPANDGKAAPKRYRAAKPGQIEQLTCRVCEADTGIATSLGVYAIQSPMWKAGKVTGGTKAMYCLHCMVRGVTTKLST